MKKDVEIRTVSDGVMEITLGFERLFMRLFGGYALQCDSSVKNNAF